MLLGIERHYMTWPTLLGICHKDVADVQNLR